MTVACSGTADRTIAPGVADPGWRLSQRGRRRQVDDDLGGRRDPAGRVRLGLLQPERGADRVLGGGTPGGVACPRALAPDASAEQRFAASGAHVQALRDLLPQVADGSNLTLDPDVDTFYRMNTTMTKTPQLLESLRQLTADRRAVSPPVAEVLPGQATHAAII